MKKTIYDVGANNGDDIPYYLMKADVVVAIEANPRLCALIAERFDREIATGRVIVENCAVTAEGPRDHVDFYIHRTHHVWSQLSPPSPERADQFERVQLPSAPIIDIVKERGTPHYIKIDVEHHDAAILRSLFEAGIRPPYISAESHSAEVFSLLVSLGHYDSFKLIDGGTVSWVYANRRVVNDSDGVTVRYSFPAHSAGPFGEDIDGEWMTADNFLRLLALEGLGWKDVHATTCHTADPSVVVSAADLRGATFRMAKRRIGRSARRFRVARRFVANWQE